jgi:hypothetical protein
LFLAGAVCGGYFLVSRAALAALTALAALAAGGRGEAGRSAAAGGRGYTQEPKRYPV